MKPRWSDLTLCLCGGFDIGYGAVLALRHAGGSTTKFVIGLVAIGLGIVLWELGLLGMRDNGRKG